jgi:hypothetical protein
MVAQHLDDAAIVDPALRALLDHTPRGIALMFVIAQ